MEDRTSSYTDLGILADWQKRVQPALAVASQYAKQYLLRALAAEKQCRSLEKVAIAAKAWFEVQRGTMSTMGPTGLAMERALKEWEKENL